MCYCQVSTKAKHLQVMLNDSVEQKNQKKAL